MVRKNVSSEIIISPYKIEQYYAANRERYRVDDQVRLRVIYLANKPDRNAAETRKLADDIEAQLASGTPFTELAGKYSDLYRNDGGDFGWKDRKELDPQLAEKLFSMKAGQQTGVMMEPNGCRIILVEEFRGARVRTLSEVFPEIEAQLMVSLRQQLQTDWMTRLKAKSYIRLIPGA
jgi:parvulin-like peptidyl-prolyl isomerase